MPCVYFFTTKRWKGFSLMMAADEEMFQELWKGYFKAMTIKERINPRLQRQHMPKRFWKYLTEKQ
ncbi:MAG: DUF4130 domain-containing protein [Proteiniphilum sp.]